MNIYIVLIEYSKLKYNYLSNGNSYIDTLLPAVAAAHQLKCVLFKYTCTEVLISQKRG